MTRPASLRSGGSEKEKKNNPVLPEAAISPSRKMVARVLAICALASASLVDDDHVKRELQGADNVDALTSTARRPTLRGRLAYAARRRAAGNLPGALASSRRFVGLGQYFVETVSSFRARGRHRGPASPRRTARSRTGAFCCSLALRSGIDGLTRFSHPPRNIRVRRRDPPSRNIHGRARPGRASTGARDPVETKPRRPAKRASWARRGRSADGPRTGRGDAVAATWIVRGGGRRWPRRHLNIPSSPASGTTPQASGPARNSPAISRSSRTPRSGGVARRRSASKTESTRCRWDGSSKAGRGDAGGSRIVRGRSSSKDRRLTQSAVDAFPPRLRAGNVPHRGAAAVASRIIRDRSSSKDRRSTRSAVDAFRRGIAAGTSQIVPHRGDTAATSRIVRGRLVPIVSRSPVDATSKRIAGARAGS